MKHLKPLFALIISFSFWMEASADRSPFPEGYDRGYSEALRLIDGAFMRPYSAPRGDLPRFISRAKDGRLAVADRWDAIKRISGYTGNSSSAESALTDLMDDANKEVAFVAALGLVALRSFDPERLAMVLLDKLKEGTPVEQTYALRALKNVSSDVSEIVREAGATMKPLCDTLQNAAEKVECQKIVGIE